MKPEDTAQPAPGYRCGYAAIAGRPNVGKSTLLNRLVGTKLSITSRKPQTTRWNLLGISTDAAAQVIYVDTPGLQARYRNALNRHMSREAAGAVQSVDVVLFVVEAVVWTEADAFALKQIVEAGVPILLVINKVDRLKRRDVLLPYIETLRGKAEFVGIVPVSALKGDNIEGVRAEVRRNLPEGAPVYPADQLTDRGMSFIAAEIVREKLTRKLGEELPYSLSVTIDEFRVARKITHIAATIWVESESQKAIVIGRGGSVLKSAGEQARREIEKLIEGRVNLKTWVKVKRDWTSSAAALRQFGYNDGG
ncbi:MAG TPA: GTPase Era [Gammaproteobacteria bacterium]|jgi:GTP-binding protein Era